MFKNRSVHVKMVKDTPDTTSASFDLIDAVYTVESSVNRTIKTGVYAATVIIGVKTASELTLHIAKTLIK